MSFVSPMVSLGKHVHSLHPFIHSGEAGRAPAMTSAKVSCAIV